MPHRINLAGRVAVVTGAGSGIGRASALALARSGARVHAADIDRGSAERTVEEIGGQGGNGSPYELDVADPAAVEGFAASVFASEPAVDVLLNNAGIGHAANVEATTVEDWRRVIGVNLLGVAYGIQAFVPRMLAQGRPSSVVNTASMAGLVPTAKMAPYVASKYGVVGLTEALNAELSKRGVHFTAICPGIIDTAIVANGIMRGDIEALHGRAVDFYARRGASPEEVADAVLRAVEHHPLIVPVPRRQVALPYILHRISPRLTQPISRGFERVVGG
ncbi:MAG TPA: SDR family NAD(P)-dependent oxidoreductase [Solirubrobacteraceae bacterium]|nr:SDR family NAD(P)-dependent oxidoreductase [Solirubrobacteraceae bacterium]